MKSIRQLRETEDLAKPMCSEKLGELAHRLADNKNLTESTRLATQITDGFYGVWDQEIQARLKAFDEGRVEAIPFDEVKESMAAYVRNQALPSKTSHFKSQRSEF